MIYGLQKASMGKRISALLFDIIMTAILSVGIMFLLSAALGYDGQLDRFEAYKEEYEERFDIDIDSAEYEGMTREEKEEYDGRIEEANKAMLEDAEVMKTRDLIISLTMLISSVGIFLAFLVLEFIVPLFFKHGQTLGKKIFSVAVMRIDGVKASNVQLFVRSILGKYTLETMLPICLLSMIFLGVVGLTGTVALGGLMLAQLIVPLVTRNRSQIHDLLAGTVAVDFSSQLIFDSAEQMRKYEEEMTKGGSGDARIPES